MTRAIAEDMLNSLSLRTYLVIALINMLLLLGGLTFIYWADEYAVPSWHTRSVPAPRLY